MQDYTLRKYTVEKYNPQWEPQFILEANMIQKIFGDKANAIHHIGSTAIPGLSGKPTIDILVVVKSIAGIDNFNEAMEELDYTVLGEYVGKNTRLFAKEQNDTRLLNVHVFEENHSDVEEMLTLRDYLRSHPKEVEAYSALKEELYMKYPNDYASYRRIKDEYMEELKGRIAI